MEPINYNGNEITPTKDGFDIKTKDGRNLSMTEDGVTGNLGEVRGVGIESLADVTGLKITHKGDRVHYEITLRDDGRVSLWFSNEGKFLEMEGSRFGFGLDNNSKVGSIRAFTAREEK